MASLFIDFMGDSPVIRVIDCLLTEREIDFSITDLAKNANIGRATLYRIWGTLIKSEIIVFTREIGKARLYKLNTKNSKVKKLIEIDDILLLESLNKIDKKMIIHS